jgi:hypothetical protein
MKTISEHILDITQNSIKAGANTITISLTDSEGTHGRTSLLFSIEDDGCGMDEQTVKRVTDPFYTTRTTRKVGMGIPFLKQNAEQTGGSVTVSSEPGKGTILKASFITSNIDCPPLGDIYTTVALLITGNPGINIIFRYIKDDESGTHGHASLFLSTADVKEAMGDMDISLPKVTSFLKDMIYENLSALGVRFF